MWLRGDIPQELGWMILVLIPKGTTDTRGIGLMETLWKVVEVLIDTLLGAIPQMHDALHGFRSERGTGSAIMEVKLAQELARMDKNPPLPGIPGPSEGLQHSIPGKPAHNTEGVWSGASDVGNLGDLLVMPAGGSKAKQLQRAGLIYHKGYNASQPRVPDAIQRGGRQHHQNLDGHDGRRPADGSGQTGRYCWAVRGSLLCRRWHVRIVRIGLAAARNGRPGRHF